MVIGQLFPIHRTLCSRDAHADHVIVFALHIIFSQSEFPLQYNRLSQPQLGSLLPFCDAHFNFIKCCKLKTAAVQFIVTYIVYFSSWRIPVFIIC